MEQRSNSISTSWLLGQQNITERNAEAKSKESPTKQGILLHSHIPISQQAAASTNTLLFANQNNSTLDLQLNLKAGSKIVTTSNPKQKNQRPHSQIKMATTKQSSAHKKQVTFENKNSKLSNLGSARNSSSTKQINNKYLWRNKF